MAKASGTLTPIDLVGIGEVLAELSVDHPGAISRGAVWHTSWGGDVVNTLFYAGRAGLRTGLLTRFGTDPFTPMIYEGIAAEDIDMSFVTVDPDRPNGIYFIQRDQDGERSFHYRRGDSAAREMLDSTFPEFQQLADYLCSARVLLITGVTLAIVKDRDRLYELIAEVRERAATTVAFDPNLRPSLWNTELEMRNTVDRFLPLSDVFLPSADDLDLLRAAGQTEEEFINRIPIDHIILKRGAAGAKLYYGGEVHEVGSEGVVPVVDTTGAGDALNGRYLAGLLLGENPVTALTNGLAVARHVVGVVGAIDPLFRPRF